MSKIEIITPESDSLASFYFEAGLSKAIHSLHSSADLDHRAGNLNAYYAKREAASSIEGLVLCVKRARAEESIDEESSQDAVVITEDAFDADDDGA